MTTKEKIIDELNCLKEDQLLELEDYISYLSFKSRLVNKDDPLLKEIESWQDLGIYTLKNTLDKIENENG